MIQGEFMKISSIITLLTVPFIAHSQSMWGGYGLQGGLQGCGYNVSMGSEAQSYKDDIKELQQQISQMEKDRSKKKEQLRKVQNELRKHDSKLRTTFSSDAYSFIKSHFDEENRCQDYRGHIVASDNTSTATSGEIKTQPSTPASVANTTAAVRQETAKPDPTDSEEPSIPAGKKSVLPSKGNTKGAPAVRDPRGQRSGSLYSAYSSRMPAAADEEADKPRDIKIDSKQLNADWEQVCDVQNNPKAQLRASICSKKYLWISESAKPNINDCQAAVLNYPKSKSQEDALKREIEALTESIKVARESIKDNQTAMRDAQKEEMQQRIEEMKEGGICYSCLAGGSDMSYQTREPNWGGVVGNSLMALLAYNGSKSFYGNIADKNANLGFPTQMPMISPIMAAAPYFMGAIGAGLGQGSFGCAGMAGGINGMGGAYGPYAALGGMGQIGGAFGTPAWALGGQLGGGAYLNGMSPWGMNGPWGLNGMGMGMYPQLMAGAQMGLSLPGLYGMNGMGSLNGMDPYSLAMLSGMGGMNGMGAMGGGLMNPYAALGGSPYGAVAGMNMGNPLLGGGLYGNPLLGGGLGAGLGGGLYGNPLLGGGMLGGGMPGIMGLGGMGGMNGLGALGGGLGGMNGLGNLGMLGGGNMQMQQQMMQMQMQQQQQMMQQQMQYYQNYMQKQQAAAGLQTELMGLLQRYQQLQYGGSSMLGASTNFGVGISSGGFGGLPTNTPGGATPSPLGNRR